MSIVSSVIVETSTQRDGRRWVRERHTDHVGVLWFRTYLAGALDDLNAALSAYAAQLATDISNAEIGRNVAAVVKDGSVAVLVFTYSTASDGRSALREAYRVATRVEAIMIGDFLSTLTDGQLQTLFGMTAGQVTTLRANKLTPAAASAADIRAAAGQ